LSSVWNRAKITSEYLPSSIQIISQSVVTVILAKVQQREGRDKEETLTG
jgi:hypothetical protein